MINEICLEIKNFFTKEEDKHIGDFSIVNGQLAPSLDIEPTRLIRIVGSAYNDGVHYSNELLNDEEFHGGVWVMSPPPDFLNLCEEIEKWQDKNGAVDSIAMSPFNSESFGGYSYTKATSESNNSTDWKTAYKSRLNIYRRARL